MHCGAARDHRTSPGGAEEVKRKSWSRRESVESTWHSTLRSGHDMLQREKEVRSASSTRNKRSLTSENQHPIHTLPAKGGSYSTTTRKLEILGPKGAPHSSQMCGRVACPCRDVTLKQRRAPACGTRVARLRDAAPIDMRQAAADERNASPPPDRHIQAYVHTVSKPYRPGASMQHGELYKHPGRG